MITKKIDPMVKGYSYTSSEGSPEWSENHPVTSGEDSGATSVKKQAFGSFLKANAVSIVERLGEEVKYLREKINKVEQERNSRKSEKFKTVNIDTIMEEIDTHLNNARGHAYNNDYRVEDQWKFLHILKVKILKFAGKK